MDHPCSKMQQSKSETKQQSQETFVCDHLLTALGVSVRLTHILILEPRNGIARPDKNYRARVTLHVTPVSENHNFNIV